jgi:acetoin utilization protein AcuB
MTTATPSRMHQFPTVRQHMSPGPFTVGAQRPLAAAQNLMREEGIRHLPVLDGGRVVGLISERDVLLVESMPGVNPTVVRVDEAMSQSVFEAAPDDPVADVVQTMIDRKLGSAVVVEDEHVVGVFTTIDALTALVGLLREK